MAVNVVDDYKFDPTGATDNASKFAQLLADLKGRGKQQPRVVWPEGIYTYSVSPNLALANLDMAGQGYVELHYTGTDDALVFNNHANLAVPLNIRFDNFRIVPTEAARDGLVLTAIHHSYFGDIKVLGAGAPRGGKLNRAVVVNFAVCTDFDRLSVSTWDAANSVSGAGAFVNGSFNCIGVYLFNDTDSSGHSQQTTDCRFLNPIIESNVIGVQLADAGGCMFSGGTVEGCSDTGLYMQGGGQNRAWGLWLESNTNYDIWFGSGAKDNDFNVAHPSKLKVKNDAPLRNNMVRSTTGLFS